MKYLLCYVHINGRPAFITVSIFFLIITVTVALAFIYLSSGKSQFFKIENLFVFLIVYYFVIFFITCFMFNLIVDTISSIIVL